jgi:peroxiredoxin
MIGLFGLLVVVVISVAFLTSRGAGTAGVPAGKQLPLFSAPLAASTLNGAANLNPPCTEAKHDLRALNICLLVKRAPLVLAFFVTSSKGCEQQVGALQTISRELPPGQVEFAAVAVSTSHSAAAKAVRQHHWTIPVAYDVDGRVGAAYGVEVCPIVELARRGVVVARRLIGQHWASVSALAPQVRALVASGGG